MSEKTALVALLSHPDKTADAIITALTAAGFKILPRWPTKDMLKKVGVSQSSYMVTDWLKFWDAANPSSTPKM